MRWFHFETTRIQLRKKMVQTLWCAALFFVTLTIMLSLCFFCLSFVVTKCYVHFFEKGFMHFSSIIICWDYHYLLKLFIFLGILSTVLSNRIYIVYIFILGKRSNHSNISFQSKLLFVSTNRSK